MKKEQMTNLKSTMMIPLSPPNSIAADKDKKIAKSIEFAARQLYPGYHNKTKATKVYSMLKSGKIFDCKSHMASVQKNN